MTFSIEKIATILFALALVHSFSVSVFARFAQKYKDGSAGRTVFHWLSEVELVFGFWALLFLLIWSVLSGPEIPINHLKKLNFTEAVFIFCIMILASSRPLVTLVRIALLWFSEVINSVTRTDVKLVQFFVLLTLGPLIGSLITEPAAITLVALLLYRMIDQIDDRLLYGIIALLFVNISIGGGLTHFAAPPILMVASTWNWGIKDIFHNLGEAVLLAIFVNTTLFVLIFKNKMKSQLIALEKNYTPISIGVVLVHISFLVALVIEAHHPRIFIPLFVMFVGFTKMTKLHQDGLKFREGLLVGLFLAGLIVFGSFQRWWLEPLITSVSENLLYFAATALTGITDNAALTYLGSQVQGLSESSKWALVSGAISGGGLSILANAPNPVGFSILSSKFRGNTLNAGQLFIAALGPTMIVVISFMILGNF
jgi:hypothetical protein